MRVVTNVSYTVPPNWTAGSDKTGASKNKNPNDPNMLTTGAYGSAFELMPKAESRRSMPIAAERRSISAIPASANERSSPAVSTPSARATSA